ncbi:MAG: PEP-CTERM sorting domain-containing protein [Acidobacteriaceae bacterium]|jgi:hypothetical protein
MRKSLFVLLLLAAPTIAKADTFDVTSTNVYFAVDFDHATEFTNGPALEIISYQPGLNGEMLVGPEGAWVGTEGGDFNLFVGNGSYSSAGIVLYPNGGMTLGQLQSVSVDALSTYPAVSIALLLDPVAVFFGWEGDDIPYQLLSPALGYCSFGATVSLNSSCSFVPSPLGAADGQSYTLAQLIAGDDSGVDASTQVALWIGPRAEDPDESAFITDVDVTLADTDQDPATTPEPSSLILLGTGCLSLVGVIRKRIA